MLLVHPLDRSMLEATSALRGRMPRWKMSDEVLGRLRSGAEDHSEPMAVLRIAAINAVYGTNLYAVFDMASHIHDVMSRRAKPRNSDVVEEIARLDLRGGPRHFRSFASKYAHFFINADAFPILDSVAEESLKWHLGSETGNRPKSEVYAWFVGNFRKLQGPVAASGSSKALDEYLWLSGLYRRWLRAREKRKEDAWQGNREAKGIFKSAHEKGGEQDLALLKCIVGTG